MKEAMEDERRQEEAMYANLWEKDMLAKADREERDAKAAHERNAEVLAVLRKQMAALEAAKEEGRRLKEEEAQLLVCCQPVIAPNKMLFIQPTSIVMFLISSWKHMLWVLIRSASMRHF